MGRGCSRWGGSKRLGVGQGGVGVVGIANPGVRRGVHPLMLGLSLGTAPLELELVETPVQQAGCSEKVHHSQKR